MITWRPSSPRPGSGSVKECKVTEGDSLGNYIQINFQVFVHKDIAKADYSNKYVR